jgi:hypothetical protein
MYLGVRPEIDVPLVSVAFSLGGLDSVEPDKSNLQKKV